ncbi:uncharacterized protein N7469_003754 [Penicillium citrinum]|uniref:Uncharacterized protein n=1 Tax=Penicillium citrinum TaxID=5077 RepID=A0A9W9P356_PENCI|nr:uncharacterized protein N7469_003754 [Penicillium citrinum]KAJ5234586.1 hypothetical protein N7469_003754 [Penicillium citrinum]
MLVSTHFGQLYPTRYLRDVWDQKLSHWCGEVAYDLGRIELLQLGDEAQKVCSPHVEQHYMPALSKAAFSFYEYPLKDDIEELALSTEHELSHNSTTNEHKRQKQLLSLMSKFVEFKAKLENQNERYRSVYFAPGEDFDESTMISFTGQFSSGLSV